MTSGMNTIMFPVKDIAAAKVLYATLLGVEPSMDQPYYVGFDVAGQHFGLDPNGHAKGLTGPLGYWTVDDVEQTLATLVEAGAKVFEPEREVGGGRLTAIVQDADGNKFGLLQMPE